MFGMKIGASQINRLNKEYGEGNWNLTGGKGYAASGTVKEYSKVFGGYKNRTVYQKLPEVQQTTKEPVQEPEVVEKTPPPKFTPTELPVNDPYADAATQPTTAAPTTAAPTTTSTPEQPSFSDQLSEITKVFQSGFQKQIADMQAANETRMTQIMNQMQTYQQQAAQSQRELMIGLQARDRNPADVRMARSGEQRRGLSGTGTTGYFGRGDMRISSLNVPTSNIIGLAGGIANAALGGSKGSFA